MDAPKCRTCGNRHYGLCADVACRSPAERPPVQTPVLASSHSLWLAAHPARSVAWLLDRLRDGFVVLQIDGKEGNDQDTNLILIDGADRRKITPTSAFDKTAYQREYMRKVRAKKAAERL